MTIAELIKDLVRIANDIGDDAEVILAKDPEGNGFSPAATVQRMKYEAYSTWDGQTYPFYEDDPSYWEDEDPEDEYIGLRAVVEIGPVN